MWKRNSSPISSWESCEATMLKFKLVIFILYRMKITSLNFSMVASHDSHEDIGEELRFHITTTHHRYGFVRSGKLGCMEQKRSSSNCAAGLGQDASGKQQMPHC